MKYLVFLIAKATGFLIAGRVYIFGGDLLVLWVGETYASVTVPLLLLITSFVVAVPELVASNVLTMTGYHRFSAVSAGLSTTINIVVSLLLIRPLGLTGVALGTVISSAVVSGIVVPAKAAREYGFPYLRYITSVYLPAALPTILLVGAGYGMKFFFSVDSLWDMMFMAIPGILVYLLVFWNLFTDKAIKEKVRAKLVHTPKR
jgi:O-antigen/teichoic acid export membrane protein